MSYLDGFPSGEMNVNFTTKFIWACTFLFVYSLAGEIFVFKIVKTDLTNLHQKHKYISIFALSANTFQLDQIADGC